VLILTLQVVPQVIRNLHSHVRRNHHCESPRRTSARPQQLNFWFRCILVAANKRLSEGERAFDEHGDNVAAAASLEGTTVRDAAQMQRGFRFLI
jgi:hypothetical protein